MNRHGPRPFITEGCLGRIAKGALPRTRGGSVNMAKPMEYVIELNAQEARVFLADIMNPKPNPARDKFIAQVKKLNIEVRP